MNKNLLCLAVACGLVPVFARGQDIDLNKLGDLDLNSLLNFGGHIIASNNQQIHYANTGGNVSVSGSGNQVTISGITGTLAVLGSNNTITADQVDRLVLIGIENKVHYLSGHTTAEPTITQIGQNNVADRRNGGAPASSDSPSPSISPGTTP